jgi:nitrite reductase/ring-hydroxylating ferredoxin subunit
MPNIRVLLKDIPSGTPLQVTSGEIAIAVVRSKGQIRAFEDVCPHAFWPLSAGEIEDDVLICPGHGWEFSLETGQCRNASIYCLRSVPLTIEGDTVILDCDNVDVRRLPRRTAVQPKAPLLT